MLTQARHIQAESLRRRIGVNVRGSGPELERKWPLTEIKKQTFQILKQILKGKWLEERTQGKKKRERE